jgi:hypothetical protein
MTTRRSLRAVRLVTFDGDDFTGCANTHVTPWRAMRPTNAALEAHACRVPAQMRVLGSGREPFVYTRCGWLPPEMDQKWSGLDRDWTRFKFSLVPRRLIRAVVPAPTRLCCSRELHERSGHVGAPDILRSQTERNEGEDQVIRGGYEV